LPYFNVQRTKDHNGCGFGDAQSHAVCFDQPAVGFRLKRTTCCDPLKIIRTQLVVPRPHKMMSRFAFPKRLASR